MELMESFIDGVEAQALRLIEEFHDKKEMHEVTVEGYPEHSYAVTVFQGLDDQTWDIHSVFNDHFPNLQRRSALLTLVGLFEHEIDKLCEKHSSEIDLKICLSDITGKGLERSTKYLLKVAGIDTCKTSAEWKRIKQIQVLRNSLIHQNGKITDANGQIIPNIMTHINEQEYLSHDNGEVLIGSGYLKFVLYTYHEYIRLLDKSIKAKYEA